MNTRRIIFQSFIMILFVSFIGFAQQREGKGNSENSSVKMEKTMDAKTAPVKNFNTHGQKFKAPPEKSLTKSRGDDFYTKVIVDNYTEYYIEIWADGTYEGTVGPYADGYFTKWGASVIVEGYAYFDNGDVYQWGPATLDIHDIGEYTWNLK